MIALRAQPRSIFVEADSECTFSGGPKYCQGAIKNIQLARLYYPDWKLIFYVAPDVPADILERLQGDANVTVIQRREPSGYQYALLRFEAFDLDNYDIVIFRDTDSRLSDRESSAVRAWIHDKSDLHIMRDHPNHKDPILAGMWGIKRQASVNMTRLITDYISEQGYVGRECDLPYGFDQQFLADVLYPCFLNRCLVHDEFHGGMRFPMRRQGLKFVGQVFDENDYTNLFHLEQLHEHIVRSQLSGVAGLPARLRNKLTRC